jgi:predicted CXXCH cytochrome family protein
MNMNPDGAVWPNGDNLPLADYYLGTSGSFKHSSGDTTTDMACFTCHAAHDGVDSFMLRVKDDNSRICVGCHTDFRATFLTTKVENPSNYISEYGETATSRLGSHYTGTVTNSTTNVGEVRWTFSGGWTDTIVGTATKAQTSHWLGGNGGGSEGNPTPRLGLRMQCQSCHTPHDAATGLVEANAYDGSITPVDYGTTNNTNYDGTTNTRMAFTPTTALLLGSNQSSKMCATCHWPAGTHVTTIYTVPAKPDPARDVTKRKYRDYCTRTERFIISILNGEQEYLYNVYDLIADGTVTDPSFVYDRRTPESPCNFPPLRPGVAGGTAAAYTTGEMLCDSCHAPHGAATGGGAFILEDGTGTYGAGVAVTLAQANQRVSSRNYQELCWKCHDK